MFRRYGPLIAVGAVGCLNEVRFEQQYTASHCALLTECDVLDLYDYASPRACEADTKELDDECEDFSAKTARECIDQTDEMSCADLFHDPRPKACKTVCG